MSKFRQLNDYEKSLFNKLLEKAFPGRDELVRQLEKAQVQEIDDDGCLRFSVPSDAPAPVLTRVPVEGLYEKEDLVASFLLHTSRGFLDELEVVTYKGQPKMKVNLDEITLVIQK
jgi:hypothetical protein